jgi:uncharacterized membrane protein YhaH (DUF805 family)
MSFTAAIKSVLNQYLGFAGRARRSEYWWWTLFTVLLGIVAAVLDSVLGTKVGDGVGSTGIIALVVNLLLLLPSLAVLARRLHDTDRSGWWILIGLVPLVGAIVLLVFTVSDSKPGANRFGPSPK